LEKFFVRSKSLVLLNTECEMFFVFCFRDGNRFALLKLNCYLEVELFRAIVPSSFFISSK